MKFIHTADWHLGKLVHGIYMTEEQRYILEEFIELVKKEEPDAVIIAGDLYDRSVPPTEAVELLDEVLYRINVELKTPIVAVSGNHDSAERLSFGSSWYKHSQFHLKGKLTNDFTPITIKGVHFHCVPYAEPGNVRQILEDDSINSHHAAMEAIVKRIEEKMNPDEPHVFVGHAFVLGGKTTDSERTLSVGGSGCVGADVFKSFHYSALGHLHSPDAIKHETIRYSGSLLKYSFSEASQRKSVSIVEMDGDGSFRLREEVLKPKQDMRELQGLMEELLDPAFYQSQKVDDYLKITLHDEGTLIDPINQLRQVYPNVLHLERKMDLTDAKKKNTFKVIEDKKRSELDMFKEFYGDMTTGEFTNEKEEVLKNVIDKARKEVDQA
ncbi:exonuclease SbcCD subunit D [Rossellomorea aquimaris]|uniref:Nuclease SbcCD subunit D n=1 Tax=Rossellomorea aquimaris TaxID=189382 RepID=A0A5D4UCJ4_9BACI|nr:exonuclease SbcCD subunit D [Rossellomorea aquimaris]TYS79052.1 exonuclease SbcCD subunit D [Rossellomorea aquimaris]TYS84798.1 exonuclease SbcCD subunit D [Rossellomorea aquimaris]